MAHRSFQPIRALHPIVCSLCFCFFWICCGRTLAQTVSAAPPTTKAQPATAPKKHAHKHPRKTQRRTRAVASAQAAPVAPPAPVKPAAPAWPIPPAQQPAQPATVTLNGDQLTIVAKNSSLQAILNTISKQTGLKVVGLDSDMRIYGTYGPATVIQTINALLQGSQYNYVLVGGDAKHPPKELDLSLSH